MKRKSFTAEEVASMIMEETDLVESDDSFESTSDEESSIASSTEEEEVEEDDIHDDEPTVVVEGDDIDLEVSPIPHLRPFDDSQSDTSITAVINSTVISSHSQASVSTLSRTLLFPKSQNIFQPFLVQRKSLRRI